MKDLFSANAQNYLQYRPDYPEELFKFMAAHSAKTQLAWDCGTGNGQAAIHLVHYYDQVFATDLSARQIEHAIQHPNIQYQQQLAEKTSFPENSFDLILVAQAIHWFDFEAFYREVVRTAKKEALLAIIGYNRLRVTPEIDQYITHFYTQIIGPYWDKERRYIDEGYQTIPFPFQEIKVPDFYYEVSWTFDHLIGYLKTWSAVSHYIQSNQQDPIDFIRENLQQLWGANQSRIVRFPILFRLGKIHSGW